MSRDISRRYAVMYRGWPVDSDDDQEKAKEKMKELMENQKRGLGRVFLFKSSDVSKLWSVIDTQEEEERTKHYG